MTCKVTKLGPDSYIIQCSRGLNYRCRFCGSGNATKLCDFPLRGEMAGKTCDIRMCARCAVKVGENKDYCPPHARMADKEKEKEHGT